MPNIGPPIYMFLFFFLQKEKLSYTSCVYKSKRVVKEGLIVDSPKE